MSMIRSLKRNIAKGRLQDAGYDRVNKRMSMTAGGSHKREAEERGTRGRRNSRMRSAFLEKRRKNDPPVWRRVTEGDLAKKAEEAVKKASLRRAIASEKKKMERKRRRPIHAEPVKLE